MLLQRVNEVRLERVMGIEPNPSDLIHSDFNWLQQGGFGV